MFVFLLFFDITSLCMLVSNAYMKIIYRHTNRYIFMCGGIKLTLQFGDIFFADGDSPELRSPVKREPVFCINALYFYLIREWYRLDGVFVYIYIQMKRHIQYFSFNCGVNRTCIHMGVFVHTHKYVVCCRFNLQLQRSGYVSWCMCTSFSMFVIFF